MSAFEFHVLSTGPNRRGDTAARPSTGARNRVIPAPQNIMATPKDQLHDKAVAPGDDEVIVFPISFAQQRLWFLEQLTPGSIAYNIPLAVKVNGKLDIPALERALGEIVRRHETLRTSFSVVNSQAVQV